MEQLLNMKNNIYPARYKKWNKNINLIDYNQVMYLKKFDLIIVGSRLKPFRCFETLC